MITIGKVFYPLLKMDRNVRANILELMNLHKNYGNLLNQIRKVENPELLKNLDFHSFEELNGYINELTEKLKVLLFQKAMENGHIKKE